MHLLVCIHSCLWACICYCGLYSWLATAEGIIPLHSLSHKHSAFPEQAWIANAATFISEDLSASEKAELAASRGRYPGRALRLLLGGPLGGVIPVGAAVKAAVQTPVLSWATYKVG